MPGPHPFDRFAGGQRDRDEAAAEAAFEEGKVRFVLKSVGLNVRKAEAALRAAETEAGRAPNLTFAAFHEMYASFPLVLHCSRLGGVQLHLSADAMLPALFMRFAKAPFVRAYEQLYEQHGSAVVRQLGLVFPRNGIRNGMVIYLADDPQILPWGHRETVLVHTAGTSQSQHWLVVRSFQKAIESIHNGGHGWHPNG